MPKCTCFSAGRCVRTDVCDVCRREGLRHAARHERELAARHLARARQHEREAEAIVVSKEENDG